MIKKITDANKTIICVLACTIFAGGQAMGQTPLIETCVSRLEDTSTNFEERFFWQLMLVDAFANHDLERAATEAKSNLRNAQLTENRTLIAVTLIDSVLIIGLINNFEDVSETLWKAIEYYDEAEANSVQSIHFNTSYIWSQLASGIEIGELDSNFVNLKKAVNDCEQDVLVLNAVAQIVLNPSGKFSNEFTRDELLQILESRLKSTDSTAARFAQKWIESRIAKSRGSSSRPKVTEIEETCLLECLEIAKEANANFLLMKAYRNLGLFYFQKMYFSKAIESFERWQEYAKAMKYSTEITAAFVHIAAVNDQIGNPEKGIEFIQQAHSSESFTKTAFEQRQALFDVGQSMYARLGDVENTKRYGKLLADRESIARLKDKDTKLLDLANAAAANLIASQAQQEYSAVLEKKLAENEAQAQSTKSFYQNALMSTIVGVLGFILGTGLLISRRRVLRIREQLDTQRESAREDAIIRRRLETKVSHMQKMESLGMLAGGVAHDFNNLLVGVMCNAEVIKMHGQGKDRFVDERTHQIIQSAEKAAELSRQMLAYAGKQKIERQPINLNRLIHRLQPILNSAGGKSTELKLSLSTIPVVAEVDATQIEQVLINLVTNARQAMSDRRSQVIIRTGIETVVSLQDDPNVVGRKCDPGEFAYIEVEDFGCGIPVDDLQRIYEPFYSKEKMGRGLGLAVVYGIVDGHEGLIRTESTVGKGTRIRILLPKSNAVVSDPTDPDDTETVREMEFAPTQRQDEAHRDRPGPHSKQTKPTILVVDDQINVLNSTRQLLEMDGWRVITKDCGKDALEALKNPAENIDGVLLDVVMPEMDGDAVLKEMLERSIHVKVVLMSGYSQTQLDEYLEHPLVVSVIKKPFRLKEILGTMNRCFRAERKSSPN